MKKYISNKCNRDLGCDQSHSTNNFEDLIDKNSSSQRPHLEARSFASDVAGYLESRKMTSKDIGGSRYVTAICSIHKYVKYIQLLARGYVIEIFIFPRYSIAELLSPKSTAPPMKGCTGKETQGKIITNNFFQISSYIRYLTDNQAFLG